MLKIVLKGNGRSSIDFNLDEPGRDEKSFETNIVMGLNGVAQCNVIVSTFA